MDEMQYLTLVLVAAHGGEHPVTATLLLVGVLTGAFTACIWIFVLDLIIIPHSQVICT